MIGKPTIWANVLPYDEAMQEETLYDKTLRSVSYMSSPWHAKLNLPRMDFDEGTEEDCLGNGFPACGGCLWAQGVIQCP